MFAREFIESFLKGYSEKEKEKISKDLKMVEAVTFDEARPNGASTMPVYLATAGGPGSGKSTTLEEFMKTNDLDHYVYADPDQVSLKNMSFTYRKSLTNLDFAEAKSNHAALKYAYDKWRGASNYICHEILQVAFGKNDGAGPRYSVAHGTTSTSPHIASLYKKVKDLGYQIVLLLCYSQDETRKQAVTRREKEQAFVQTDPSDVISKGADFSKRFDIYLSYANEIYFYWNDELIHGKLPTPCAKLVTRASSDPVLTILNQADWVKFCKKYLEDIQINKSESCKIFEKFIPKSLLDRESPVLLEVKAIPSTQSISVHSGKVPFWGAPDDPKNILCRNEVRANTYPRP